MRNPASLYKERKRDEISIFVRKKYWSSNREFLETWAAKVMANCKKIYKSLCEGVCCPPSDLKQDNLDTNLTFFIFN